MKKLLISISVIITYGCCSPVLSQNLNTGKNLYNLRQCIEIALNNNVDVKQAELEAESAHVSFKQSKTNLLPEINAVISHTAYNGRSINPYTNAFINERNNAASYSLSGNMILWNGSSRYNFIKQNELDYQAGLMDARSIKDKTVISIILNYISVLSTREQLTMARSQVEASRHKVELLQIRNNEGAISPSDLYDMRGQLANDELTVVSVSNNLKTALLNLTLLMCIPYSDDINLLPLADSTKLTAYSATSDEVYQNALQNLAMIKSADFKVDGANRTIRAIKGQLLPVLYLSGGLYTNYSGTATSQVYQGTQDVTTADYVMINNVKSSVMSPQSIYNPVTIGYGTQLKNNFNSAVSLGLQIPLLNGFQVRSKIKQAQINEKQLSVQALNARDKLRNAIEQDFANLSADYESYQILLNQVENFRQSLRAAEVRFEQGAISAVDYIMAKNNFERVNNNLISTKYNYLLRTKLLDFYQNKPIW